MPFLTPDRWFAVQVAPQHEAKVAALLAFKGYEHFYPTFRPRRRHKVIKKHIEWPLFPGYVFCRTGPEAVGLICTTPGIVRLVGARGKPCPIPEEEIDAVRRVVRSDLPVERFSQAQVGHKVQVKTGPLTGVVGKLVSIRNRNRLLVSVEITMKSVAVDIDPSDVVLLPTY
jgi:transcription antitermination factor NusG